VSGPLLLPYGGILPTVAEDAFVAPGAVVIGDVEIGSQSSVWFNVTIRGDVAPIRIGDRSNVQDNSVLHVDAGTPCVIGNDVTIGHGAIVHACTVEDGVLIGMGAVVLSRARIGAGALIAAGAVVGEDAFVEPGAVMMGVPAKPRRIMDQTEREKLMDNARRYVAGSARYRAEGIGQ